MQQLSEKKARPPVARALRRAAAALLCVAALSQPNLSTPRAVAVVSRRRRWLPRRRIRRVSWRRIWRLSRRGSRRWMA